MEPAAPGTEDDTVQPTLSKKASDDERLLSIKAQLPSGRYGNVFSKSYNDGMEQWYCNTCECPVMGRMFHHETGKRHTQQLAKMDQRRNKDRYNKDGKFDDEKPEVKEEENLFSKMGSGMDQAKISVAPGEPVPPGVEGDSTKVAQIQDRLDKFKASALLGLEYLLEITDYDVSREPSYLCALCDKKGDPRTVIAHLVSYNHLQQFMQRHFPATYRALSPFITRQYRKNWQDTMNSIAEAIETKYGRLLPHPVDKDTFEKKKDFYYQMIHMGPHFSEKNGVTFESMVKPEEITKNIEEDGITNAGVGTVEKKRSPSPPVVAKPTAPKRVRSNQENIRGRRNSLSSVSSVSSNEMNEGGVCAKGIGRSPRGAVGVRGAAVRRGVGAVVGRMSRSMSISPDKNGGRKKSRSRSGSRSRYQNVHNPRYINSTNYRGGHATMNYRGGHSATSAPYRGGGYNPRYGNNNNSNSNNNNRRSRSRSPPRVVNRSRSRSPRRLPWERSNYTNRSIAGGNRSPPKPSSDLTARLERAKSDRESKLEEYSRLSKAIENDMSRVLKGHEKNPEKHKDYNEEWKLFWNKRYKELQTEGKDAANFDFKPEWILVWNKRMMELHNVEVKIKKEALRRRLGLRDEPNPISFRIGKHSPSRGPAPVAAQPDQDHEVIVIDDKDDDIPATVTAKPAVTTSKVPTAKRATTSSSDRSHSPWETDIPAASQPKRTMSAEKKTVAKFSESITKELEKSLLPRSRAEPIRNARPRRSSSPDLVRRTEPAPNNRSRDRSLERSIERERKRSPLNSRDRDIRGDRDRGIPPLGRDRERVSGPERRDSRDNDRRYDSRDRERLDGRRSRGEREPSWERDRKGRSPRSRSPMPLDREDRDRYYRDHPRTPDYFFRERSWERVINQHREMRMVPQQHPGMHGVGPPMPDAYRPPMIMRDVTSLPMHYMPPGMGMAMHRPMSPEIEIPDDEVTTVSVLRLLTALEETLGSLGPKIIEMLATALAMEKHEPNSSETMMDNEINCVLFETVKEKLKGRLQAGLVTYKQEKAVKFAIKSLASLIHQASERKRIRLQQAALNPLTVPGVGVVDKAAIAKQIATALVLQGKTDVTQGELEQLINAVVGMAEASKHSDTPMNTATFLTKCREKTPEFTPKIIIPTVVKEMEKEKERERLRAEQEAVAKLDAAKAEEQAANLIVSKADDESSAMEGLSDSDLQTLLQNFKDLSTEEQHGLISYLKKLEAREPQRVEKLRQFVNMGKPDSADDQDKTKPDHELDEFELKKANEKEELSRTEQVKIKFDSDEEEYSYEDVFKVAKQNVTKKEKEEEEEKARKKAKLEEEEKRNMEINFDQAKMIIANLMGTISKAAEQAQAAKSAHSDININPTTSNLLGLITSTANALNENNHHINPFEELTLTNVGPTSGELKPKEQTTPTPVQESELSLRTNVDLRKATCPESPALRTASQMITSLGPSSGNSNHSNEGGSGRLNFEPPPPQKAQPFDSRLPFDLGNRDNMNAMNQSLLNLMSKMSGNLNPPKRDHPDLRQNPMSTSGGGNGNAFSMNNDPNVVQNRIEFRPQQQQQAGGATGGGQQKIPPPPPQPPFQGGNPFGMLSYPNPSMRRNYGGGESNSSDMHFGGFNNDPQMGGFNNDPQMGGFNPFQDDGPSRGGGFNMNNMNNMNQQQDQQRGGYNNNNNNNRW